MIDSSLIQSNTVRIQHSIHMMEPTLLPGLYVLENVLDDTMSERLRSYIDALDVDDDRWQTVAGQDSMPRSRISWDSDTVIEELHQVFESATVTINTRFPDCHKNFWCISLWKDRPGYEIGWHTDNPDIDVAIQLYLYTLPGMGTVFGSESEPVLVPSNHNSGYLAVHPRENKISHRSESVVPPGTVRYSLYAIWSRLPKHTPDT